MMKALKALWFPSNTQIPRFLLIKSSLVFIIVILTTNRQESNFISLNDMVAFKLIAMITVILLWEVVIEV